MTVVSCQIKGLLTEGFFWIPSLAGPTTIAARQNGSGISWLFPFKVSTNRICFCHILNDYYDNDVMYQLMQLCT